MKRKLLIFLTILLLVPIHTSAQITKVPKVLVLYSTENGQVTNNIQILNTLLGHFTGDVTLKNANQSMEHIAQSSYTHVIYIGEKREHLPDGAKQFLESFSGPLLFLGQNIEQFSSRFSFITLKEEQVQIRNLQYPTRHFKNSLHEERLIQQFDTTGEPPIAYAIGSNGTYPFIVKQNQSYYVATSQLFDWTSHYVGEMLFSYFGQQPETSKHRAYLRLEDVHPAADPKQLQTIAELLKEKNIPYMIAVIPVYKDPNTGKTIHFQDKPELLDVLRFMQNNGGSIIMHGYTHQFYDSETGEGFEFWDIKTDQPIRYPNHEMPKTIRDFKSKEAYDKYMKNAKNFEEAYITERIEKGIEELTLAKLYPLAFEAPHYAISQKGYEILSRYFSTYVGQLQLEDTTWKAMHAPAFPSKPSFLHGMNLLPETVGFIEPNQPHAASKMKEHALSVTKLSDGIIGAFYHPYLGVKPFKELLNELETIPNIEWIDLQRESNEVKMKDIHITSNKDGIHIDKPFSLSDTIEPLKKYGFFLILGIIMIVFLLLVRRAKRLES
ncbi:polysaccharide deacetylase family protein [Bacillus pfraonensis]|uniref:polysaccharide deacetylase family protein n=1 Tax=Bacillus TaxID=1386 RepID=UPI002A565138|nr:polysaccharide deacetylase family protein [Bacillus pseudomycoides]